MAHYFRHMKGVFTGLALTSVSTLAFAGNPTPPMYTPDLLPPNPQTGECYARVEVPAQYRTDSETVMIQEQYTTLDVSQPQISSRQEDVLVKEASVRYEVRQPTYRTVTEKIMTRPAYEKLMVSPPQFAKQRETVKISNARLVWKKGNPAKLTSQGYKIHSTADAGARGQGYGGPGYKGHRSAPDYAFAPEGATRCGPTCEIWCLVEEPAKHVTYDRKVLSKASEVRRVPVSAKYTAITKQVVSDPGGVREVPVPAQYRSITMETVNPGYGTREVHVPAKYGTIGKKVMTSPSRYEWRRVVCLPGTHPNARNQVSRRQVSPHQSQGTAAKSYATHSGSYTRSHTRDLSGYSRTQHKQTRGEASSSSSRHHFTIPAKTHRTKLPKPVTVNTREDKGVGDHESYTHHMGKRAKPRYRK